MKKNKEEVIKKSNDVEKSVSSLFPKQFVVLKNNPERCLLKIFFHQKVFSSDEQVLKALEQYLKTFCDIEKKMLSDHHNSQASISLDKNLLHEFLFDQFQQKKVSQFLINERAFIFGLGRKKSDPFKKSHFLVKRRDQKIYLYSICNNSLFSMREILNEFLPRIFNRVLLNLLEGDAKRRFLKISQIDEVTGVYNQRKLLQDLDHHISHFNETGEMFSLLFLDIDFFKKVNDEFGHIYGGKLLKDIAAFFLEHLKSRGEVYRYGGDEFIILLPATSLEESKLIAKKMISTLKERPFCIHQKHFYNLSLSIGISVFPDDARDSLSIIHFADKMMYQSKREGRGKIFHVREVL